MPIGVLSSYFLLQIYKKYIKESHKSSKKATNGLFFTICSYFLFK